ncbi:sulfite exporter TauE/SafE family protein [Micromonospora aurantiaca]|uniref:sulfite exporter TauE/SafE family protein n=1 Tax=Micromonospora aurantiaca (nom. illeg.) TaxID=47850 RepID=UPI0011A2C4D3|nr:sulfite exporter TauE/SafE family protein [Micromonospora aurantiaca]
MASGGNFLLAPLYLLILRLPIKRALATSLAVSAALALPGTVTHWALGRVDRRVVATYTVMAVPAAYLRARLAIRSNPAGSPACTGLPPPGSRQGYFSSAADDSCHMPPAADDYARITLSDRSRNGRAQGPVVGSRWIYQSGPAPVLAERAPHRGERSDGPAERAGRGRGCRDGGCPLRDWGIL